MNRPVKLLYIENDVEDWRAFMELVQSKELSWDVEHADTLAAARSRLAESRYDVIVTEYHLPDGHCTDLFDEAQDTPFILLTDTLEEELSLRTLVPGADDYLPKAPQQRHLDALPFTIEKALYRRHIYETELQHKWEIDAERTRWQGVVEGIADEVWTCDAQGRMSLMNLPAVTTMGLEEFENKTVEEVIKEVEILNPDGRPRPLEQAPLLRSLRGEIVRGEEIMRHRRTGRIRYRQFSSAPIRDASGNITGAVAIARDITEEKRTEEAVRRAKEEWEQTFNMVPDLVAILDNRNRIVRANLAMAKRLGLAPDQCAGKCCYEVVHGTSEPPPHCPHTLTSIDGEEHVGELCESRLGGDFLCSTTPRFNEMGRLVGAVLVARDITERKKAEAERETLIRQLEAKNAELERFAYTVSHDLKSPLVTIKGHMDLFEADLARGALDRIREDIPHVNDAIERMMGLLRDVLHLARAGKVVEETEEVDLNHLAIEALQLVKGRLDERDVHVEIAPGLPVIRGSHSRLVQVFQNLIDNAGKFTGGQPEPRIDIGARCEDGMALCWVRDNGMGLDPKHADKIFGLFDKLNRETEGTGIGLSLVRRIVEAHGGRVWAESEGEGKGAVFYMTLPLA